MAKLTLNTISSGFASTTLLNENFETIATALENTLSRDGTTPNTMSANLDMNGKSILNQLASSGVGFTYLNEWITATAYALNNLVSTTGRTYICIVAHTSGTFATDLAAAKWQLFADKGATGASGAGSGDLVAANNLSDVLSAATARSNLGLVLGTNVQAYDVDISTVSASQVEMEAGTESALRSMSPLRIAQAISALGGGNVIQVVEATPITTVVACPTSIPVDDTIPQNTEGDQVITVSITPSNASNRLFIEFFTTMIGNGGAAAYAVAALFQDSTANALAVAVTDLPSQTPLSGINLVHEMAAGTTSATTFKIRIGAASSLYVNAGPTGARLFGGISVARLRVTEILV